MRTDRVEGEGITGDLLFRICAAPDADHREAFAALDPEQWEWLAEKAWYKRVAPLLHRSMERAGALASPPPDVAVDIDKAVKWHSFYAMRQAVAISRLLKVLGDEGLQPVALKGLVLAYRDYPAAALRPLRDVDLLLSESDALRAQAILLAHPAYRLAPWAGQYGVEHGHQLPEVQDIEFELTIEVHHRVNARNWAHEAKLLRKIHEESEQIEILGQTARVPSVHANLLHLIEHATLHHAFENGPLIFADLHFVAMRHQIDWPCLLAEATAMGLDNSLHLLAGFARKYGAIWVPEVLAAQCGRAETFLDASREALLQDRDVSQQHRMLQRIAINTGRAPSWSGALSRALRPNPFQLAKIVGTHAGNPLRWLGYPAWLVRRGLQYVAARRQTRGSNSAERELQMIQWLEER